MLAEIDANFGLRKDLSPEDQLVLSETLNEVMFERTGGCLTIPLEIITGSARKREKINHETIARIARLEDANQSKQVIDRVIYFGITANSKYELADKVCEDLEKSGFKKRPSYLLADFAADIFMQRKDQLNWNRPLTIRFED